MTYMSNSSWLWVKTGLLIKFTNVNSGCSINFTFFLSLLKEKSIGRSLDEYSFEIVTTSVTAFCPWTFYHDNFANFVITHEFQVFESALDCSSKAAFIEHLPIFERVLVLEALDDVTRIINIFILLILQEDIDLCCVTRIQLVHEAYKT